MFAVETGVLLSIIRARACVRIGRLDTLLWLALTRMRNFFDVRVADEVRLGRPHHALPAPSDSVGGRVDEVVLPRERRNRATHQVERLEDGGRVHLRRLETEWEECASAREGPGGGESKLLATRSGEEGC